MKNTTIKNQTMILKLLLVTLLYSVIGVYGQSTTASDTKTPDWKPTITEEKKDKIQDFILYFMDAERAEMAGDDDYSQGFPWRSFQATIKNLKTAEASGWIIETIPSWVDGRDQESLALLCQKAADLATPKELEKLIGVIKDKNTPEDAKAWALVILESTSKEENLKYLEQNMGDILSDRNCENRIEIAEAIITSLKAQK